MEYDGLSVSAIQEQAISCTWKNKVFFYSTTASATASATAKIMKMQAFLAICRPDLGDT